MLYSEKFLRVSLPASKLFSISLKLHAKILRQKMSSYLSQNDVCSSDWRLENNGVGENKYFSLCFILRKADTVELFKCSLAKESKTH